MYGIIYRATNIVNKKVYVGQTTKTLEQRVKEHYRIADDKNSRIFQRAIAKYGEDKFEWEIIDTAETKEELNEKEILWISNCKSYIHSDGSHGYNMSTGGESNKGWKLSDEQLKKWSDNNKGEKNPNYGNVGELAPMYGKNHTDESRKRMSENRRGKKRTEEMRQKDRDVKLGVYANENNPRARAVIKLTKDGEFIESFPTAKQGAESVNGKRSAITNCCNGLTNTSYGFKWVFADDYKDDCQ